MSDSSDRIATAANPESYRYDSSLSPWSRLLEELLKGTEIRELFDSFYNLITIPVAIIDLGANVLFSSRWQRICTDFHRINQITCRHCVASDRQVTAELQHGKPLVIYPCPNGLTDCASPIVIEGTHVANLFIGQFLTEEPDENRFRRQAEKHGFDVDDYLAAVREVPVVPPDRIRPILDLLARMTRVITDLGIDRKRAIDSEARQSIILDTIPQSVFWKDLDGNYLGCNAAFAKAAGFARPEDVVGKNDFDLPWPRKDAEAYRADDRIVLSENRPKLHIIETLQQADGSRFVIDTSKVPLTGPGGIPYGVLGIYNDITELKRKERELKRASEEWRATFDATTDLFFLIDREHRITKVNRAVSDFLEIPFTEIIGRHFVEVMHGEAQPLPEGLLADMTRTMGHEEGEFFLARKKVWVQVSVDPILDRNGDFRGAVHVVRNINERKLAEEHRAQMLRLEALLSEISARFLGAQPDELHREITDAQRRICKQLGFDISSIYQPSSDAPGLRLTHLYRKEEGVPVPDRLKAQESFPWCHKQLVDGEMVAVSSLDQLPAEAWQDRRSWAKYGIRSSLVLPLRERKAAVIGTISFDMTAEEIRWSEEIVQRLQLVAQIFATALVRIKAFQELAESREILGSIVESTRDFIWTVDAESFGILFCNRSIQEYFRKERGIVLRKGMRPQDVHQDQEVVRKWQGFYQKTLRVGAWEVEYLATDGSIVLNLTFNTLKREGRVFGISVFGKDVTERKKAEDQRCESERKYRELVENANSIIMRWTRDGRIIFLNEYGQRFFGYTEAETVGSHMVGLIVPEFETTGRDLRGLMEGISCDPKAFEQSINENMRRGGERVWVAWTNKVVLDEQGQVRELLSIGSDITGRRRSEAIKASHLHLVQFSLTHSLDELLEETLNEAENLTGSLIGFHHFLSVDDDRLQLQNWSRRTKAEFCKANAKERHYPLDKAGVWMDCVQQRGPVIHNDFASHPHRKGLPEGHVPVIRELVVPVFRGGKPVAILGVGNKAFDYDENDVEAVTLLADLAWEIAERKRAETSLRESETKLRAVFETSRDAIGVMKEGVTVYVNPAYLRMFGYDPNETLEGEPFFQKIAPQCRARIQEIESRRAHGLDAPTLYETRGLRKDGSQFDIEVQSSTYELHEARYTVGMIRDTTEKKQLEQQLRQAQKMEAVGTLAAGIAHDFNNILTVITGFGTLLEKKLDDDYHRRNVVQILSAADRAATLTRSLLAFSRTHPMETKVADLNGIVHNLESMLGRVVREDIDLVLSLSEKPLPVLADVGQIDQVLLNLANNARDAMPGKGVITIRCEQCELDAAASAAAGVATPGSYAVLTISDTGTGMPENIRQRIFEPFFTTKEVGKGTGLGLAVCYGIIKQHKGCIDCTSAPGQGTAFRIYLPMVSAYAETAKVEPVHPPAGGNETILVAEDDPGVRELTTSLLTSYGYTVIVAQDGDEAVAKFVERAPEISLCLIDAIMPKRNGWEILEEIRRHTPKVRVIFFSGYQPDVFRQQMLGYEGVGFVAKPVIPMELLRKMRVALDT